MGLFGKILSAPLKIINAPVRAVENLMGAEEEDDRFFSKPLDAISEEIEKIDE